MKDKPDSKLIKDDALRTAERKALFGSGAKGIAELQGTALAISGGGIRSASFALGALQALFEAQCFHRFDYLSTVSGGGYLGSTISWLKRESARRASPSQGDELFRQQFGWAGAGARHCASPSAAAQATDAKDGQGPANIWLDYIRQHGNYLQPGSISTAALIATALRGALFNMVVYGLLLTAIMAFLIKAGFLPNAQVAGSWLDEPWYRIECWALLFGGLFASSVMLYGAVTWLSSQSRAVATLAGIIATAGLVGVAYVCVTGDGLSPAIAAAGFNWRWPATAASLFSASVSLFFLVQLVAQKSDGATVTASHERHYRARVIYVEALGDFLTLALALLVVWSVPYVDAFVQAKIGSLLTGGTSAILGALGGIYQFFVGREQKASSSIVSKIRILASALLLIYGLVLLSHSFALNFLGAASYLAIGALVAVSLLLGWLINTNYFGLGRMYRDRLMEAFMPNLKTIEANTWNPATDADRAALVDFRYVPAPASEQAPIPVVQRPLHLINCCAVMVNATSDTFRGRGGDSFVLSPWYSGSNATGWVPTTHLGDGSLTLATAMAISGAAANPDAGVAGRGLTRNRLVAFLMSLLNVRLGYWLPNPRHAGTAPKNFSPNLWRPGLRQGLLGTGLNEKAAYIEVTDGGHFENTALYELIRRRVKVIVLCQAGQDLDYRMDDLANAIEKVRVDFGVHIRFDEPDPVPPLQYDLAGIRPDRASGLSRRGYAIGKIRYPKTRDPNVKLEYDEGTLVYLQTAPVADMRPDTDSYRRQNKEFPNESTADQFFAEEQLEAYRELGIRIGRAAIDALTKGKDSKYAPVAEAYKALIG